MQAAIAAMITERQERIDARAVDGVDELRMLKTEIAVLKEALRAKGAETPALRLRCSELADVVLRAGLKDFAAAAEAAASPDAAPTRPDSFIATRFAALLAEIATGQSTLVPNKGQVAKAKEAGQ